MARLHMTLAVGGTLNTSTTTTFCVSISKCHTIMSNTDSIVNKRIKVFVYIPENNGAGFLNGTGFVVFAYTFLTTPLLIAHTTLLVGHLMFRLNVLCIGVVIVTPCVSACMIHEL